jgi:hypothetical protein
VQDKPVCGWGGSGVTNAFPGRAAGLKTGAAPRLGWMGGVFRALRTEGAVRVTGKAEGSRERTANRKCEGNAGIGASLVNGMVDVWPLN